MTFNFVYMERGRRAPDPAAKLEACYRAVIDTTCVQVPTVRTRPVVGGKSMGGRIVSQVVAADPDALGVAGLVFLGYPLHPPGRPERMRDAHRPSIRVPMLFAQGSRVRHAGRAPRRGHPVSRLPSASSGRWRPLAEAQGQGGIQYGRGVRSCPGGDFELDYDYTDSFKVTASRNGIISRNSLPTCSIGCSCSRFRFAMNHGRPAWSSAIQFFA